MYVFMYVKIQISMKISGYFHLRECLRGEAAQVILFLTDDCKLQCSVEKRDGYVQQYEKILLQPSNDCLINRQ